MRSQANNVLPHHVADRVTEPGSSQLANVHVMLLLAMLAWIGIGLAAEIHLTLKASLVDSVDLLYDDAYYYLGVAWNLAHHHRSSFTAPLVTNGYHPLWLLILTGLVTVLDLSKQGLVVATLVLTAALKGTGLWLFDRGSADPTRRSIGRIALFVVMFKFAPVFSVGMETTLFIIFIPWLLRAAQTEDDKRWRGTRFGLLMSVVFLSRLDALALDMAVLGMALLTRRFSVRRAAAAMTPLIAVIAIYALINQHYFGTPLPVSGQAKAIGSHFGSNLNTSIDFVVSLRWPSLMLAVWVAARLTVARNLVAPTFELVCMAMATAACALYYGLLSGWPIWPWYLYPDAYLSVYATVAGLTGLIAFGSAGWEAVRTRPKARRVYRIGCALLVCCGTLLYLGRMIANERQVNDHLASFFLHKDTRAPGYSSYNQRSIEFIPWLTAHYPNGALIAMGDRAGGLGYWMPERYSMLQIEGLVADKEFLSVLSSGSLEPYLASKHVDLYITDRGRAFESAGVLGFVEPSQPRVTVGALNILCFRQADQLLAQDYRYVYIIGTQMRRTFDYSRRVTCPTDLLNEVLRLKPLYDGLHSYSLL